MLTRKIDNILKQVKYKGLDIISARFQILDAVNEDLRQQIKTIDTGLDKVLDSLRDKEVK